MPSLSKELRRLLEKAIAGKDGARQIAEDGAEQSLRRLAVDRQEPHSSLSPDEKAFRNQLRAHGRQLGDKRDVQRGTQTINHLKQAVAYEHWHRLLFARFLAENDLLMHPEHRVALTLGEVKEVALGKGCDWIELAAEYAQRMLLREVFRSDDPALRVPLPPEKRRDLEAKLNSLPKEIFLADDSLGWVYQFWQKDVKDEVNRSEVKIGADELSPVTQLFTEDYMVLFLLENSLGAWWTARRGAPDLSGYKWTYLRFSEDGTPAAGLYKGWPNTSRELRVLDPCMGSGHFLTFALPILVRMRQAEEGLELSDAITAVLRDNLFGVELDLRCSQIAAFNLALTAWKLAGHHFDLPPLNLACSGLTISAKEEDWVKLVGEDKRNQALMRSLYSLFLSAPTLGSLIDPLQPGQPMVQAEIAQLIPLINKALEAEERIAETHELVIAAKGLLESAKILGSRFSLVVTNVPYLGRGRQSEELHRFSNTYYKDAADDLAQVFFDRCLRLLNAGSSVALIAPQKWTYASRYKHYRRRMLRESRLGFVAIFGPGAFRTITGEVVDPGAFIATAGSPGNSNDFSWIDVTSAKGADDKAELLRAQTPQRLSQASMFENRDCLVRPPFASSVPLLGKFAFSVSGLKSGDSERYNRCFWELPSLDADWEVLQNAAENDGQFEGLTSVIFWEQGKGELAKLAERMKGMNHVVQNWRRGQAAWGHRGVAISATGRLRASGYLGDRFDSAVTVIVPNDPDHLEALWQFCASDEFSKCIKHIDNKLSVTTATLVNVPFDVDHWRQMKGAGGLLAKPFSPNPRQWIFDGFPKGSDYPLQVAVARLVGYEWPRQTGLSFPDCPPLGPDGLNEFVAIDGIVCLAPVAGQEGADNRLRCLLQAAFGAQYNAAELLARKKSANFEAWLRDEFFEEHCQLFHDRPIVWHIWDGLKEGFHALVNYHKLDRRTLEKLIYSYLGDWLTRQRLDVTKGVEGADRRLAAAEHLQGELRKILEGAIPYDIFARWKSIKAQPIGWDPDLNDGVRINIRPWISEAKLYRATKSGILRVNPNIHYRKDGGKEPDRDPGEFPWFAESSDRANDNHLSLDDKRRARGLL